MIRGKFFLKGFLFVLTFSLAAMAERPETGNPYGYVGQQGPIPFTEGGAALLPTSVLRSLKNGQLSPVMQFILTNSMFSKCIKNVLKGVPARRDSFKVANQKFALGYCKIQKCFKQGMLLSMISQMSPNPAYGGSQDPADRQGSRMMLLAMSQAFQDDEKCEGTSDNGMDPAVANVIRE